MTWKNVSLTWVQHMNSGLRYGDLDGPGAEKHWYMLARYITAGGIDSTPHTPIFL